MTRKYKFGFIIEQALGHMTHGKNLTKNVGLDPEIEAHWGYPEQPQSGLMALPGIRNWTLQAGMQANKAIRKMISAGNKPDVLFFHTQVTAVLARRPMKQIPSVVSLDATPLQVDSLGQFYAHAAGPSWLEDFKFKLNQACYGRAKHLVTWSDWAKQSLIKDYGVDAGKITIIPPGINVDEWHRVNNRSAHPDKPIRFLFVGGDFKRKGGGDLLQAFSAAQQELPNTLIELHLVTRDKLEPMEGVFVHNNMQANSLELKELYQNADIFCLPTYGDCLPMVLSEAAATELPLISTDVAAIPEIVRPGESGILVEPGDIQAIKEAMTALVKNPAERRRLGKAAFQQTKRAFDAQSNAVRLFDLLKKTANRHDTKNKVLLTISGDIPQNLLKDIAAGEKPRADYIEMQKVFGADLIDYQTAEAETGLIGKLLKIGAGKNMLLAWECFRRRKNYTTLLTDGEQIGLPYALLMRLFGWMGSLNPTHLMIVHILSTRSKETMMSLFGLQKYIDRFLVYSTRQQEIICQKWSLTTGRVLFTPFMVDQNFFSTAEAEKQPELPGITDTGKPYICSVGLEFRDYPTLMEAVVGLDVHIVIAAGSPWSKREDQTKSAEIPENVTVECFTQKELRKLYQKSSFMVMPLLENDFQAGITAILEAMSMDKAIICSRTRGQIDVIKENETGLYVEPENRKELREAIVTLLNNKSLAEDMGKAGRQIIEDEMNLDRYTQRLNKVIAQHLERTAGLKPSGY